MQVNILDAKNRLSQLVRAAQAGQTVVIANRGHPVAQLVAAPPAATAPVGDIHAWLRDTPLPAHARRSAQEIDADLQGERDAWA